MYKTYDDFLAFIEEKSISEDTKLLVPYRKSVLSEIEWLELSVISKSLVTTNESSHYKEYDIPTAGKLKECIRISRANNDIPFSIFTGEIRSSILRNGDYHYLPNGNGVTEFISGERYGLPNTLILETHFY